MATLSDIQTSLRDTDRQLTIQEANRNMLLRNKTEEKSRQVSMQTQYLLANESHVFLLGLIAHRRSEAMRAIEIIATAAVRSIYGEDYSIRFATFEDKTKAGEPGAFRMELQVISSYHGKELVTGLAGHRGGGLTEAVAFALRIAFLQVKRYNGPLIIDEAYSAMSHDGKIESLAAFLNEITSSTGLQIIFVTHSPEPFLRYASNVVNVANVDGQAQVANDPKSMLLESFQNEF